MFECEFREALPEEAQIISDLVNSAYRGDSSRLGWTTEADLLDGQRVDKEMILEMLNEDESTILVACPVDEDEILGCVHLKKDGTNCLLGMLTTSPQMQKKGIGKQLLSEAEAFADFWDCQKIQMKVISIRQELIAWYLKQGFKLSPHKEAFPYGNERFGKPKRDDLEFAVLEKKLSFS
ncbi:MAG: GNAT family N-acetyltransferase [Bdellovibrionia bacterium]